MTCIDAAVSPTLTFENARSLLGLRGLLSAALDAAASIEEIVQGRDASGRTLLCIAASQGLLDDALAVRACCCCCCCCCMSSPGHEARPLSRLQLISKGADVGYVSASKRAGPGSALHEATVYKHVDVAKMLLTR